MTGRGTESGVRDAVVSHPTTTVGPHITGDGEIPCTVSWSRSVAGRRTVGSW